MKINDFTRQLILSKQANHEWDAQGFYLFCKNMHRTDWRQNDLCKKKIEIKNLFPACHHRKFILKDSGYECSDCGELMK